jgi:hypothetical protein
MEYVENSHNLHLQLKKGIEILKICTSHASPHIAYWIISFKTLDKFSKQFSMIKTDNTHIKVWMVWKSIF